MCTDIYIISHVGLGTRTTRVSNRSPCILFSFVDQDYQQYFLVTSMFLLHQWSLTFSLPSISLSFHKVHLIFCRWLHTTVRVTLPFIFVHSPFYTSTSSSIPVIVLPENFVIPCLRCRRGRCTLNLRTLHRLGLTLHDIYILWCGLKLLKYKFLLFIE